MNHDRSNTFRSTLWTTHVRRFPCLLFWQETYPQFFFPEFLSICEYNSWKNCMLPTFQKWTFGKGLYGENGHLVRVCTEKMYRENSARNMYWNYNQLRAYFEALQMNLKNYTLSTRGGTSIWGVHGGVPRVRVIFSRKNSEKGMSIFTKIPERATISVRNSR